jgi:hypothetical protein
MRQPQIRNIGERMESLKNYLSKWLDQSPKSTEDEGDVNGD